MSLGIKDRSAAYLAAAEEVRAIDAREAPESERLQDITAVLKELALRTELFPLESFPRAEGTPGGLFRLAGFPDRRGAVYISLGYVGRSQQPHNHVAWAVVAGVSGGRETNVVYERVDGEAPGEATLVLKERAPVGPGDAVVLPTGAYHTIDVDSGPSLHLHAYGWDVDAPGFTTYGFANPEATRFEGRPTGGFKPPLTVVSHADIDQDLQGGDAVLVALQGEAPTGLSGPLLIVSGVDDVVARLEAENVPVKTPVILAGAPEVALEAALALYASGRPLVFEYRADVATAQIAA